MFYFKREVEERERHIKYLEQALDELKGQLKFERERAERAIDELLAQKGIAPVTFNKTPEDPFREEAQAFLHEFRDVGTVNE